MTYSNDIVITINQEQQRAIMAALAIQRAQVESNLATIPFLDEYEECSLEELSKQPSEWDLRKFKGEEDDF